MEAGEDVVDGWEADDGDGCAHHGLGEDCWGDRCPWLFRLA